MPKKTTKKASAKPQKRQYKASAKVMGKTFEGKGETIYEAIGDIQPGGVAGTVILTVSHEDGSKDRILPMRTAKRLFMTIGLTREVALKQVSTMFDGI